MYQKKRNLIPRIVDSGGIAAILPLMSKDLLTGAEAFAEHKHRHQFRRDGVTPYVEHPRGVMAIARDEFGVRDLEILAACLLHDTIEDTATDYDEIAERFGKRVADLVAALTKDKRLPEHRREREYFAQLARAPLGAKLCKVADTLHNLRDTDRAHRPKALHKAQRLIRIFGRLRALARPLDVLRDEMGK
jgi:guanosine-3',5'-bis(diphosphate) 3'-pyrophosphohydrolase